MIPRVMQGPAIARIASRGALNPVVDRFDQTGAELDGKGGARRLNSIAGADAGRFFIDLDGGAVTAHLYNFTDQVLASDAHDVKHVGMREPFRCDQGTCHFDNFACIH